MAEQNKKDLDLRGMCCPLPLILISKTIQQLRIGEILHVTGNDPIFESTVRDFCQVNGHALVEVQPGENREVSIRIRAGG